MEDNPLNRLLTKERRSLDEIEAKLSRLRHEREVIKAKIEAFEIALEATAELKPPRKKAKRNRPPSEDWQRLARLAAQRHPRSFGYDELGRIAGEIGLSIQKASLRTKMMNYVNEGYVDRISDGRFSLTDKGRKYFRLPDTPSRIASSAFAERQAALDDGVNTELEARGIGARRLEDRGLGYPPKRKARF